MTREELDTLWFQAMRQSIAEGEDFIRYHFANLVTAEVDKEIDALRADAKRYRWVCDHALAIDLAADPDNFVQVWVGTDPARVFRGKTLDDAIDEAMKEAALRQEDNK